VIADAAAERCCPNQFWFEVKAVCDVRSSLVFVEFTYQRLLSNKTEPAEQILCRSIGRLAADLEEPEPFLCVFAIFRLKQTL